MGMRGSGDGGKKQVAISTHQTYIKPLGRTAVASRFGFFFFFFFHWGRRAEPVLNFRTKFRYANVLKRIRDWKRMPHCLKAHTLKPNKIRKIESFQKLWAECSKLVSILILRARWPAQRVYKQTVRRTNESGERRRPPASGLLSEVVLQPENTII